MRTALWAVTSWRIEGMACAQRAISSSPLSSYLPSLLASRPAAIEPGQAVYLPCMLCGRCHAPSPPFPMTCAFILHAFLDAVCAAGHGRGGFTAPRAALWKRAPCSGQKAHAAGVLLFCCCPWRRPRAWDARFRGSRPATSTRAACRMDDTRRASGCWWSTFIDVEGRVTCGTAVNDVLQLPDAGAEARAG